MALVQLSGIPEVVYQKNSIQQNHCHPFFCVNHRMFHPKEKL